MTELDPKPRDAVEIFTAKLGPCFYSAGSIDAKLIAAFKETLDDADLVERSELDKLVPSWALIKLGEAQKKYEKLRDAKFKDATKVMAPIVLERDEARREAAQYRKAAGEWAAQSAALREALEEISAETLPRKRFRSFTVMNRGACADIARAVLADTAAAAAQYQRVPVGWEVKPLEPTQAMFDAGYAAAMFPRDREICAVMYKAMNAAAPNLSSVAEGEAGEKEGE